MIIVFIKDKLNSLDSILPILLECYEKYNQKSLIVVPGMLAYKGIKENIVIRDSINQFGSLTYIETGKGNKLIRRARIVMKIVYFFIHGMFGAKFIHFGHLDVLPYNILGFFFRKNVYLTAATPYDHYFEDIELSGNPLTAGKNLDIIVRPKPIGENFIYFNSKSLIGLSEYKDSLNIYDIGEVRLRKSWIEYIHNKLPRYMSSYHPTVSKSEKIIAIMLGGFYVGHTVPGVIDNRTQHRLFEDVLDVLNTDCNYKVLLKPHVYTDMEYVDELLLKYDDKFEITYLHPTLLAMRSDVFICVNYSTAMADGYSIGATTIEYSQYYNEELEVTKYRSKGHPYIDYFIQNDIELLRLTIKSICNNNKENPDVVQYSDNDSSGLIYSLSH